MRISANFIITLTVAASTLTACSSPVYVQKGKLPSLSKTMDGHFCETNKTFLEGGKGLVQAKEARHQEVGKCVHPKLDKNTLNVLYFGDAEERAEKAQMYAELESSLVPQANLVQASPVVNEQPTEAKEVASQGCVVIPDCNEMNALKSGFLLHFASNSDVPENVAEVMQLEKIAEVAKKQSFKLAVTGHADSSSTETHNAKLSLRRAESIVRTLNSKGIGADKLVVSGHSSKEPIASNESVEGRAANRRVEVKLIADQESPSQSANPNAEAQPVVAPVEQTIPQSGVPASRPVTDIKLGASHGS